MDREPQPIKVSIGSDDQWTAQLAAEDGQTLEPFSVVDSIECVVSQGRALPALFAPTAAWLNGAAGATTATILLTVAADDTDGLEAGVYPIDLWVTRAADDRRRLVWSGWLELDDDQVDDDGSPPKVYCSLADMRRHGKNWIDSIRDEEDPNFLRCRGDAARWLDDIVLSRVRLWIGRWYTLDLDNDWLMSSSYRDTTIRGYLDQGPASADPSRPGLVVDDRIREIVAREALARACEGQPEYESGNTWEQRARHQHAMASNLVKQTVAQIDTDGDGLANVAYHLGVFSMR